MSESNRTAIRIAPESVYGTQATTGWVAIPFQSETLGAEVQTIVSNTIRSDRMVEDQIITGMNVGGDVSFELSYGRFDSYIEAALLGTWTANVLKIGTVKRSFSIEKQFLDVGQYIRFTGQRVGGMSLNFQYGQVVTGSFSFAGNGTTASGTAATGTTTTPTVTDILSGADIANIEINGVASTLAFRTINISIDNGLRPIEALGSRTASDQAYGDANITGNIEVYFANLDLYNSLIGGLPISVQWQASDAAGNSYIYLLPKLKLSAGTPQASGRNQDVIQNPGFTALPDPVTGTSLQITRTPAA